MMGTVTDLKDWIFNAEARRRREQRAKSKERKAMSGKAKSGERRGE
jgi:hypothetical protein